MWLSLNEDNIVWPGGLKQKPTGLMIPTHLNVLTIEEKPFVYSRPLASGDTCDPNTEILCPHYNTEVENPMKSCKSITYSYISQEVFERFLESIKPFFQNFDSADLPFEN